MDIGPLAVLAGGTKALPPARSTLHMCCTAWLVRQPVGAQAQAQADCQLPALEYSRSMHACGSARKHGCMPGEICMHMRHIGLMM